MINKNIAVLCGGWSEERLISLKSGDSVFKCLKENGYEVSKIDVKTASEAFNKELYSKFDLVFILLHGRGGKMEKFKSSLRKMTLYSLDQIRSLPELR